VSRRLLAGASAIILLIAACGGSGAPPGPTATLAPPPISPNLDALGSGFLELNVPAKGRQEIDTQSLAKAFDDQPDCGRLVFLFSWQVPARHKLVFQSDQNGKTIDVVQGQTGQASVGCMLLEAVNNGSQPLTGSLRYFVAEKR
jgi:hypothetical protein